MPSGRTHDRITLWSLPVVAGLTFERTQDASLTLVLAGGYLFSGLMFGPDLDVHSRQYKRWGVLRWIWLPYRHSMRHRSVLSHGFVIGTLVRLVYLGCWLLAAVGLLLGISAIAYGLTGDWQTWVQAAQGLGQEFYTQLGRSLLQNYPRWLALLLGLELGAMSHAVSDWCGSRYKRWSKRQSGKSARLPVRRGQR